MGRKIIKNKIFGTLIYFSMGSLIFKAFYSSWNCLSVTFGTITFSY